MNFIEQVIQGTASTSEIYDRVEFWHTHETGNVAVFSWTNGK